MQAMDAAKPLRFESLLAVARAEALNLLRELLRADTDSPPALLRERRLAACAILRVKESVSPSGGALEKVAESNSANRIHAAQDRPDDRAAPSRAIHPRPTAPSTTRTPAPTLPALSGTRTAAAQIRARAGADTG